MYGPLYFPDNAVYEELIKHELWLYHAKILDKQWVELING